MAVQNPFSPIAPAIGQTNTGGVSNTPPPAQSSSNQMQTNLIWVHGMEEVLNHPASPNTQLYFMETDRPVIWMRETDAKGNIRNPIHRMEYSSEDVPFGPEANFVTKEEHQKLYNLVSEMSEKISELAKKWE